MLVETVSLYATLYPSLVQHLLGALLELAAALVIQLLFVVLCYGCRRRRAVRLVADGARVRVLPRVAACRLVLRRARAFVLPDFERRRLRNVGRRCGVAVTFERLLGGLLADDVEHRVLERLLVLAKAVLLPGVVEDLAVELVALQTALEQAVAGLVVRLLLELQRSAVVHVFFEFRWVSPTKLFQGCLNFLFLNVVILFVLRTARQSLPWKASFQHVK